MKRVRIRMKEGVTLEAVRESESSRGSWPIGWRREHWKLMIPFGDRPVIRKQDRPEYVCVRISDNVFKKMFDIVKEN